MNEHELLDRLDDRAAAAAADLRTTADARPIPDFDAESVRPTPVSGMGQHRFTRPLAGIAAAAMLLAGAGAWWITARDDAPDPADTPEAPTVEPRPFVATELPDGMIMTAAFDGPPTDDDALPLGPATVYGPADTKPGLVVYVLGEWSSYAEVDSLERFELDGREAYVGQLVVGGGGTHVVVPIEGDRAVLAGGPSFERDELLRVATRTTVDGLRATVPDDALPEAWRPLVEADAMGLLSPFSLFGGGAGPWTVYSDNEAGGAYTLLGSLAGDEATLFAATLFAERVEEVTVRGHRALVVEFPETADGFEVRVVMVTWLETPGELVQLSGVEMSVDELLAIAEGVRPVPAAGFADLVERSALDDLDADPADTVGEGRFPDGTRWILRQGPDGSSPDLRVAIAGGGGESSVGSTASSSDTRSARGFRGITTIETGGRTFAGGFVSDDVVIVELRQPDGSVLGNAKVVTGAGHTGWVTELDAPATVVVALTARGDEVASTTLTKSGNIIRGETESVSMSVYITETEDGVERTRGEDPVATVYTEVTVPEGTPPGD